MELQRLSEYLCLFIQLELLKLSKLEDSIAKSLIDGYFLDLCGERHSPETKNWFRARRDSLNSWNFDAFALVMSLFRHN